MFAGQGRVDFFFVLFFLGVAASAVRSAALNDVVLVEEPDTLSGEEKRGGGRAFGAFSDKRAGGRAFQAWQKRAGGRAFREQNDAAWAEDKRAGARPFVLLKRGGARPFQGVEDEQLSMAKRGGGRAFYSGGFNLGSLYAPSFPLSYEKKADYVPYYWRDAKRAGGRAFQHAYYDPHYWYVEQKGKDKRAGGRNFPILGDDSMEKRMLEDD